mmetsp:Transcript_5788/g.11981  ORF Transcript_5788/g.11981 Transcript_5788/m.11981 type:complete len:114 (-) Transcript_5788:248-589(-)
MGLPVCGVTMIRTLVRRSNDVRPGCCKLRSIADRQCHFSKAGRVCGRHTVLGTPFCGLDRCAGVGPLQSVVEYHGVEHCMCLLGGQRAAPPASCMVCGALRRLLRPVTWCHFT